MSIAELCWREGLAERMYYKWSKEFLDCGRQHATGSNARPKGRQRLAGDLVREATSDEVKVLCKEAPDLKEVVAELTLELRLLKKSMFMDGETANEVSAKSAGVLAILTLMSSRPAKTWLATILM